MNSVKTVMAVRSLKTSRWLKGDIMAFFRKRLSDILAGFHKTMEALDELESAHRVEINSRLAICSDHHDQIAAHNKEIDSLEAERLQALAVKDKIAGLIGA